MDGQETIGAKISALRKARKITYAILGEHLGVPAQLVYKWENGEAIPDGQMLEQLAQYFGVSVSYFGGLPQQTAVADTPIAQNSLGSVSGAENAKKEERVICPFCGKDTPKDKRFCQSCGSYLKSEDSGVPSVALNGQNENSTRSFCKYCGFEVPKNAVICPTCGGALGKAYASPSSASYNNSQSTKGGVNFWAIIALVCSLAVGFIPGLVFASVADNNSWKFEKPMDGMSKAARIISIVGLILTVVTWTVYFLMLIGGDACYSSYENSYYY